MRRVVFVVYAGLYPAYCKGEPLRSPSILGCLLTMFFYMVETQRENLEDDFVQNFHPIFFFAFSFHFRS